MKKRGVAFRFNRLCIVCKRSVCISISVCGCSILRSLPFDRLGHKRRYAVHRQAAQGNGRQLPMQRALREKRAFPSKKRKSSSLPLGPLYASLLQPASSIFVSISIPSPYSPSSSASSSTPPSLLFAIRLFSPRPRRRSQHKAASRFLRLLFSVFPLLDAPTCKAGQKMLYGLDFGESANISCEVDAMPPEVTFRWQREPLADNDAEPLLSFVDGTRSWFEVKPLNLDEFG